MIYVNIIYLISCTLTSHLLPQYPVMAIDNYVPVVDPFSGLHFGQLKVVLAMGSESQVCILDTVCAENVW